MYIINESGYGKNAIYSELFNLPPLLELPETPIVLQNVDDFGDKFIHITFDIIDVDESRSTNYHAYIPDENLWKFVTSVVNNGANMVWNYLINSVLIHTENKQLLEKISIELDLNNLTFTPTVTSTTRQTLIVLEEILQKIINYKTLPDPNTGLVMYHMLPKEERSKFDTSEEKLNRDIAEGKTNLSYAEENECDEMQAKLRSMKKLVAQCSIVDKTGLPIEMQNALNVE
jgi:hypothetical protein